MVAEYALKLDSYYYDMKRKTTIVIIKVRNKRIMNPLTLNEIFNDKNALTNLHPIDLCILGIIANSSNHGTKRARILDSFSMAVIKPILEISKREFNDGEEILTLNLKHLSTSIKISANDLYKNEDLMNALNYQDAIAVGHAVSDSPNFIGDKITVPAEEYSLLPLLLQASFIGLLILSALMCGKLIYPFLMNSTFSFSAEILMLPLIIYVQSHIYKIHGFKFANACILAAFASYIVFLIYYGLIVSLPFPSTNNNSEIYNKLYVGILSNEFNFIMSFFLSCLFYGYIFKYLMNKNLYHAHGDKSLFLLIMLFFFMSTILSIIFGKHGYSIYEFIYSISGLLLINAISILVTHTLMSSKRLTSCL